MLELDFKGSLVARSFTLLGMTERGQMSAVITTRCSRLRCAFF
jgi:hypothetical protein